MPRRATTMVSESVEQQPREGRVRTVLRGPVAEVVIDNPRRRNAVTVSMMRDLEAGLVGLDAATRVVLLRGAGPEAFVSGADIQQLERNHGDHQARTEFESAVAQVCTTLSALPVPVVAAVRGYCMGAGMALALACDLRLAETGSVFAIPAARLGVAYPVPLVRSLVETAGPGTAGRLLYTGGRLTADQAHQAGLVDEVASGEAFSARVEEVVAAIGDNAPLSVRAAKVAIRAVRSTEADPGLVSAAEAAEDACWTSQDFREGTEAFLDRRPPQFQGR